MPNFRVRLQSASWTPQRKLDRKLYDAVKDDNLDSVVKLLEAGADPNATVGKKKMTAMARAADPLRNREIERALLKAGGLADKFSTLPQEPAAGAAAADGGGAASSGLLKLAGRSLTSRMSFLSSAVNESLRRRRPAVRRTSKVALQDGEALGEESVADGQELELPEEMQAAVNRPKTWEFPRERLRLAAVLGEGQFGKVWAGEASGLIEGEPTTRVAVKQITSKEGQEEFDKEVRIMKALSGCDRVVCLLGVCTDEEPHFMLMELMPKGDLKTALRAARPKRGKPSPLSLAHLGRMLRDVALGMAFLGSNSVIHRDLAARNCLVGNDYGVKIGDFGLTRNLYTKDYYRHSETAVLPIRWMSVEALTDGVYTTAGDVWSFGVVLWEVVTLAKLPYSIWTNHEVYENVVDEDYRLPRPKDCPPPLYALTALCWKEDPAQRATFSQLADKISALIPTLSVEPLTYQKKGKVTPAPAPPPTSDYEVPVPRGEMAAVADGDGNETDDSFVAEGGVYLVVPETLEPTPAYYGQAGEVFGEFIETKEALRRSPTKWIKS